MKKIFFEIIGNPMFLLGTLGNILMIILIIKSFKKDKPIKLVSISWFSWFILNLSALISGIINHAQIKELGLIIGYTLGSFIIFLLSITYGTFLKEENNEKWYINYKEEIFIFLFVIGSSLFYIFGKAEFSNIIIATALLISAIPIMKRVWEESWQEPFYPWLFWFLASIIGLFYVQTWNIFSAIIPVMYFTIGLIVIIPIVIFLKNKHFLKKSIITTLNDLNVQIKIDKNFDKLTSVARHLNLIKENEYFVGYYIKTIITLYKDYGYVEEKIFIKKEKNSFFVKKLRANLSAYLCLLEDKGININRPVLNEIMDLLKKGKYFSAKSHFEYESDKFFVDDAIYLFLKKIFKK